MLTPQKNYIYKTDLSKEGFNLKNITEEINKLNSIIKQKQQLINNLSKSNKEKSQELIARINNDILTLKRKVLILTEKQNTGIYIPPKPELRDQRYKKLFHKEALDILDDLITIANDKGLYIYGEPVSNNQILALGKARKVLEIEVNSERSNKQ